MVTNLTTRAKRNVPKSTPLSSIFTYHEIGTNPGPSVRGSKFGDKKQASEMFGYYY